jgi:hypothetical protein
MRTIAKILLVAVISTALALVVVHNLKPEYEHYLDMTTIVDYEASADGLLLITNDGSGYWLEIRK